MKHLLIVFAFVASFTAISQTIYHPTGRNDGIATVVPGKTYHYYDDGGINGNYIPRTSSILTIYPSEKGQYVSIKCNSFSVNSDVRMYIFDGNHAGAPILAYVDIHSKNRHFNIESGDVFTASSKNKSGALSIHFTHSNRRATLAGWDFDVSCSKTAGTPPPITSQDCSGAIKVCSDRDLTTKSSGYHYQELPGPGFWNGILNYGKDGENQSNWYKFEVKTSGTIEFLIKPHKHTDFDWALWGPYDANECPCWTTDKPLRLSAGDGNNSTTGITGLSSSASDHYEDSPGDGFLAPIDVKAGQHFVLMIDDWSGNSTTFDLSWKFLNGASLECKKDKDPPVIPDEDDVIVEIEDDTVVTPETIEEPIIENSPCDEANLMSVEGETTEVASTGTGGIDVKVEGGEAPYAYKWTGEDGKILTTSEDLIGVPAGEYVLEVKDANECVSITTFTLTVEVIEIETVETPKLEAEVSQDEAWVTVSYPGAFEYKIENKDDETVITGHAVDSDVVEITKLPPGTYRVSLIYKKIKQYTTFVKN